MTSFFHKSLHAKIKNLSEPPKNEANFSKWVEGEEFLKFIDSNQRQEELVVYAASTHTFIHTVLVPIKNLVPLDKDDLLNWSFNPYTSRASIWYGGSEQTVGLSYQIDDYAGSKTLTGGNLIIFAREFSGMPKPRNNYYELLQELSHVLGVHWLPERQSYCKFDQNGDFEDIVSMTDNDEARLITIKQEALQEFLIAGELALVQMFDFSLYKTDAFPGWDGLEDRESLDDDQLFYRQRIKEGVCGYIRGVQLLAPSTSKDNLYKDWSTPKQNNKKQYVEFIAQDWRNKTVSNISTDPEATTNYFTAENNNLPFELSPAFFRPDVLLKYKADTEKYTVGDRDIHCRAAWYLKGYHINKAGQVHAYICDLRNLPYTEQIYWRGFNEEPKSGISEQAFTNDFEGRYWSSMNPFQSLRDTLRNLKAEWWSLKDEDLLEKVTLPIANNKDEWAEACMNISKLVIEGLSKKYIKKHLRENSQSVDNQHGSLRLFEQALYHFYEDEEDQKLATMKKLQAIRSKVRGHSAGSEGTELVSEALRVHENFTSHFQFICDGVAKELKLIQYMIDNQ